MSAPSDADVVVVGAGIVGCAVAHEMAKAGLTVAVVEKGAIGGAVSGASLACVGAHMFSLEELDVLIEARALWREMEAELGADIEYLGCGQLRFVAREADIPIAERWVRAESARGLTVELLAPERAREIVPALEAEIAAATWSPDDATVNPFLACRALVAGARRSGAAVLTHTEVSGVETLGGRVAAVRTAAGRIATRWIVDAAGPWAARLARSVGVELPILPRRAQCLATEPLPPVIPCVVGACETGGGVEPGYTQIQQAVHGQVLFNTVRAGAGAARPDLEETPEVDALFLRNSIATLLWLFPSLENARLMRSWVRYEAVTPDDRFIIGPAPGVEGFLVAAGDCGTGFMHAPMIARLLRELVCEGAPSRSLDRYAADRFAPAPEAA